MKIKKLIKTHQKKLIVLLTLFILSRILIGTHYISKKDSSGHWKMVCHQGLIDNPDHVWDGDVYNISARKPMVFRPWDEWRLSEIIYVFLLK